jgi:succinyl-CoA synthetase alpha subunit
MKQMRAGKGVKVRVVASGGDSHSESRQALTFSKAIALLQADEKSTAPLFAGER